MPKLVAWRISKSNGDQDPIQGTKLTWPTEACPRRLPSFIHFDTQRGFTQLFVSTRFNPNFVCFNPHFFCVPYSFISSLLHPQKKYIWNRRLFKKRKLNPLSSSQLISSTPACDSAMLPPKLGSRNSGCQRLRCRVASSRTPGSSTAGAAGAAAGALVGAGTWENAAEIHGFAIVSGQPFVGQLIWC